MKMSDRNICRSFFLSFYATSFDYYYYLRITKTTQL